MDLRNITDMGGSVNQNLDFTVNPSGLDGQRETSGLMEILSLM